MSESSVKLIAHHFPFRKYHESICEGIAVKSGNSHSKTLSSFNLIHPMSNIFLHIKIMHVKSNSHVDIRGYYSHLSCNNKPYKFNS